MHRRLSLVLFVAGLLFVTASMFLLSAQPAYTQEEPTEDPQGEPGTFLTDYFNAWVNSPHARFEDEAFRHWDEEAEGVPASCATCHTAYGYQDFLGADGTEAGVLDAEHYATTSVVNCDACHNSATDALTAITFPSGAVIGDLDDSSRCMVCHQGRAAGTTVLTNIETLGLTDQPNTVSADLRFVNIHYYAAAATLYGSEAHAGFEYPGMSYAMRNEHVEGLNTCASCHSPHSLEVQVETCADCHEGVESVEDLHAIRSVGSLVDYDGDGDMEEGIAGEIEGLQGMLYSAMQMYAAEVAGTPLVYDAHAYPYMLIDTDGNGEVTEGEAVGSNGYNAFTPALAGAAFNYQMSQKDPGAYAHNPDYIIQLLYDSIVALNTELGEGNGVDLSQANRNSFGHFDSSAEAFRHWDEDGEVEAGCVRCHTAEGLPFFLEHGTTIGFEPSNSLECSTCHVSFGEEAPVYMVASVVFPSGAEVSFGEESPNNICLSCHQGRESGVSIANAIRSAGVGDDEVSPALRFRNPHYFATGASLFGSEAIGAYQYEGMEYSGRNMHTRQFDECSDCHEQHRAEVRYEECIECHTQVEEGNPESIQLIRSVEDAEREPVDYDGDGNAEEPIRDEFNVFHETLYNSILTYANDTIGSPIAKGSGYPYWFNDLNGNGTVDPDEANRDNAYASWTPRLLRAVYNYQFIYADPGAYAHNGNYLMQVMYDSLVDLGGEEAVAGFTRPEVLVSEEG